MNTRAMLFLTTALLLVAVGVILGQSLPRYLWSTDGSDAQAREVRAAPQQDYPDIFEEMQEQQRRERAERQQQNLDCRLDALEGGYEGRCL